MMVAVNTMASSNLPQQLSQVAGNTSTARIRAQNKEPVASKRAKVVQDTFPEGKKKEEAKGKGHHGRLVRRDPLYLARIC